MLYHDDVGELSLGHEWSISIPRRGYIGEVLFGPFYLISSVWFLIMAFDTGVTWRGPRPDLLFFVPFLVAGVWVTLLSMRGALGWEIVTSEPGLLVVRERVLGRALRTRAIPVDDGLMVETGTSSFWTGFFSLRRESSIPSVLATNGRERIEFAQGLSMRDQERLAVLLRERLGVSEPEEPDDEMLFDDSPFGRIADKLMRL